MRWDHFGAPGTGEAADRTFACLARLAAGRPVFAKLSAPYRLAGADPKALAARWLVGVGPANLVWGSDWPWTQHKRENDYVRLRAGLDQWLEPERTRAILWDNALRLYGFDRPC